MAQSLVLLLAKVDAVAERAGVPSHQRGSLASTVAALPWPERRRVRLMLEGVGAQTQNPALRDAVDELLRQTPRPGREGARAA